MIKDKTKKKELEEMILKRITEESQDISTSVATVPAVVPATAAPTMTPPAPFLEPEAPVVDTTETLAAPAMPKKACGEVLHVRGAEEVQGPRMGFYQRRAFDHDGRPLYQNSNGQFLYYWGPFKGWRIGDSYTSPFAGVKSKAGEGVACPGEATGWSVFAGKGWGDWYNIEIVKATSKEIAPPIQAVEIEGARPAHKLRKEGDRPSSFSFSRRGMVGVAALTMVLAVAVVGLVRKGFRTNFSYRSMTPPPGGLLIE